MASHAAVESEPWLKSPDESVSVAAPREAARDAALDLAGGGRGRVLHQDEVVELRRGSEEVRVFVRREEDDDVPLVGVLRGRAGADGQDERE